MTPLTTRILHLRDPEVRRRQYIGSLRRWVPLAARYGATVVFAENSGEDLDRLAVDAFGEKPHHLHLLPAAAPDEDMVDRGKGAMEAAMMDDFAGRYAGSCPSDEIWMKCTGRLFVSNVNRCLPDPLLPPSVVARLTLDLSHMDTRFFAATAGAWQACLTGAGPDVDMNDGVYIEHVLARQLLRGLSEGIRLVRFRSQPAVLGRSASYADREYDSMRSRLKRGAANRLEAALRGPLRHKHY